MDSKYQEFFKENFFSGNSIQVLYANYKMAVHLYTLYYSLLSKAADDVAEGVVLERDDALEICIKEISMSLYFLRKYKGLLLNMPETAPQTKPAELFNYNFGIFQLSNGMPIGNIEAIKKMADCLTYNIDVEHIDAAKLKDYEYGMYLYQILN